MNKESKIGTIQFEQVATPITPASGYVTFYAKNDDTLYKKTSAGVESAIGGLSGTGSVDNAILRADGTAGNALQNSSLRISDLSGTTVTLFGDDSSSGTAATTVAVKAGDNTSSGNGGAYNIDGGASATGTPGAVNITGGAGTSNANGANVIIKGGGFAGGGAQAGVVRLSNRAGTSYFEIDTPNGYPKVVTGGAIMVYFNGTMNVRTDIQDYDGNIHYFGREIGGGNIYPFNLGYIGSGGLNVGIGSGAASQYPTGYLNVYKSDATQLFSVTATQAQLNVTLKNILASNESTGAGTAVIGAANSPAVTNTAVYTWLTVITSDGSTGYIPVWK